MEYLLFIAYVLQNQKSKVNYTLLLNKTLDYFFNSRKTGVRYLEYEFLLMFTGRKEKRKWENMFAYIHGRKVEIIVTLTLSIKMCF